MKRQIFLVILCLMGLVWAESQAEAAQTLPAQEEDMSPIPAVSERTLALNQLAAWIKSGQNPLAQEWIRTHREAAQALVLETYVDLHASGWLNMSSWYPESTLLLPVLEQTLGIDCTGSEQAPICASRAEEVEMLATFHSAALDTHIMLLPSELSPISFSSIFEVEKKQGAWSDRGRFQMQLELGSLGMDLPRRLASLEEAFLLAKKWNSEPAEMLVRLSLAEVWAAYPQFESFQGENGSTLSDQQANLRYRNHLRRAKWLSKVLDQPALEAELSRRVALLEQDSLGLDQSEQSISKLKDPAKREALQLLLADSRVWLKQPVQARGLYRRLLEQGSSETARQVIRRWLHMGEREDLLYLKVLLEQDGRPELITELIRVYPLLGEQSVLLVRLKQESRPELRRAMTQALIPILGTAHQGDVIFQLSFLLEDADPLIRGAVAKAMLYSEDPGLIAQAVRLLDDPELAVRREVVSGLSNSEDSQLKERLLSFLDSPDESLRFSALYAAGSLHRPELLPKVLPLLQLENRNELMLVVELVKKWGSAKEIPRLEALLPELGPQERSTVKRAIAYLQGPEQWLAECILQSEASTASGSELGLNLFEALKTRYITQEMLTPYLNHPDPRIRDSVREARRFHVP